jgi:hypothetical protein
MRALLALASLSFVGTSAAVLTLSDPPAPVVPAPKVGVVPPAPVLSQQPKPVAQVPPEWRVDGRLSFDPSKPVVVYVPEGYAPLPVGEHYLYPCGTGWRTGVSVVTPYTFQFDLTGRASTGYGLILHFNYRGQNPNNLREPYAFVDQHPVTPVVAPFVNQGRWTPADTSPTGRFPRATEPLSVLQP